MSWFIRRAQEEDKEDIIAFLKSSIWANEEENELYSWKYEENPSGLALIWLAVEERNDAIVGISVMLPERMQVFGNEVTSYQGIDAFVDIDYRRQGIHTRLIEQALLEFGEIGVPFIFAFPNEKSGRNLLKLGWNRVGSIARWAKPLKAEYTLSKTIGGNAISRYLGSFMDVCLGFFSRNRACRLSPRYSIEEIREFNGDFDALWDRVSSSSSLARVRDSEYLNWKFINTPVNAPNAKQIILSIEKDNDLAGYTVLEVGGEVCYIVDIFTEQDDDLIYYFAEYIIEYLRKQGASVINFVALEGNLYVPYLKRFGFHMRPSENMFAVYINTESSSGVSLSNHKDWFITDGDCDMISH